jgi:hypothetical protein
MDAGAQLGACGEIALVRRADAEAGDAERGRRSLEDRERLADRESELSYSASER